MVYIDTGSYAKFAGGLGETQHNTLTHKTLTDRHTGRQAYCKTFTRTEITLTADRQQTDSRQTADRQQTESRQTADRQQTDSRQTADRQTAKII